MARPLRIEFAGAVYHVISRGDRQEPIYEDDKDREAFLQALAEVVERFNWRCYAYCLMMNHYHLVVETPDGNLSKGMRSGRKFLPREAGEGKGRGQIRPKNQEERETAIDGKAVSIFLSVVTRGIERRVANDTNSQS